MKVLAITLIAVLLNSPFDSLAKSESDENKILLANRMLELWPVEKKAVAVVKNTGSEVLRNASSAMQGRLPAEKQETVMIEVGSDVQAYLEEVTPIVNEKAVRLKSSVVLPFLLDNFSSEELDELVNMLESSVTQKFERLAPEIQQRYELQVIEESGTEVNSHLVKLSGKVNERLTAAVMGN